MVYIREAHSSDGWQMKINLDQNVVFANPKSYDEKTKVAGICAYKLGIEFPTLIDDFSSATEHAYTAWPDRLYVIDTEGRIAHKSEPGPFGFEPGEVESTLKRLLPAAAKPSGL